MNEPSTDKLKEGLLRLERAYSNGVILRRELLKALMELAELALKTAREAKTLEEAQTYIGDAQWVLAQEVRFAYDNGAREHN